MMKPTLVALALCAFGLSTMASAQGTASAVKPTSPAKKELVAKVLQLQQPAIETIARQMVEQPALQILQHANLVMQQSVPPEKREALAKDIQADARKYVEETAPLVRDRALKLAPTTIGTLLDDRFTEDELKQLVAMLESPVQKKYQAMGGELLRSLGEKLVNDSRPAVDPKVKGLEQSVRQRFQALVPPPAAASAPKK